MHYLFPPEAPVGVPIAGSEARFAARRVYCVGQNYAAHAREMGGDPSREPPFFFCKPADALVPVPAGGIGEVAYPPATADYQHEIELVAAIGLPGRNIPAGQALAHVWGYAVGLDMTRRDLQAALKQKGRPWELAKAFDASAPIGPLHAAAELGHPTKGAIWLEVDGQPRQRSDLSQMIWSVAEVIANLSMYFLLKPGDLVFTGTPEGVARVERGALMQGRIDRLGELQVRVV